MTRLRVGLVGLGSVAQVVHLPVLRELQEEFELVAGCDISLSHAEAVGARHGIPTVYASQQDMLSNERLDLVAVLNNDEYHADSTIAALQAGCHVLLEKPICLTLRDADAMIAARDKTGRQVMVGYMRRHASAYAALQEQLRPMPEIHHVAMRDIIGPNGFFINQTSRVIVPSDIPPAAVADKSARARQQVTESIGEVPQAVFNAFRLLNGLSSHDLSALRGLIGAPRRVIAASARQNGRFLSAMLDYGSFTASYETGIDKVGRFDAYIEIFAADRRLRLEYDTPYIRHLPTHLRVYSSANETLQHQEFRPSYRDPYTNQWLALHRSISTDVPNDASIEDATEDLRLAIAITAALKAEAMLA